MSNKLLNEKESFLILKAKLLIVMLKITYFDSNK